MRQADNTIRILFAYFLSIRQVFLSVSTYRHGTGCREYRFHHDNDEGTGFLSDVRHCRRARGHRHWFRALLACAVVVVVNDGSLGPWSVDVGRRVFQVAACLSLSCVGCGISGVAVE